MAWKKKPETFSEFCFLMQAWFSAWGLPLAEETCGTVISVVCCPAVVQAPPSWASSWLGGCCRNVCYILFKLHLCLVFLADRAEPPNYSFWRKTINSVQWQDTATGCFIWCATLALVLCSTLGFDVVMKNHNVLPRNWKTVQVTQSWWATGYS